MGIEEFGEHQDFNIPQFPQSAFLMDPDDALRFTLELLDAERVPEEELLAGLLDLFDADKCPSEYLIYLAALIGLRLDATDSDLSKREQIKQAVNWYKAKGMPESFVILFATIGYVARVYELWTDDIECKRWNEILPDPYYCSDIPSGWNPHSRIDLELEIPVDGFIARFGTFANFLAFIRERMEEVRPIHVLLRKIHFIWLIYDQYPVLYMDDYLNGTVYGITTPDDWSGAYFGNCGIWHFGFPRPNILRNGGGYTWVPDVLDIVSTLPGSPTTGDRYLLDAGPNINEIAEWDGAAWQYTTPITGLAVWVTSGTPPNETLKTPGDWRAYSFSGTAWVDMWKLYDVPRARPGPYFRECAGPLDGKVGPIDELEIDVTMEPPPDPFSYCMYHDALGTVPPHPINGGIHKRDGAFKRNCGIVFDELEIIIHAPSGEWDYGDWDDPGRIWDP